MKEFTMKLGDLVPINSAAEALELMQDGMRYRALIAAAGYFQDSSDETVTLSQDDATRTCHVTVGRLQDSKDFYAGSFNGAVDLLKKSLDEQNKDG